MPSVLLILRYVMTFMCIVFMYLWLLFLMFFLHRKQEIFKAHNCSLWHDAVAFGLLPYFTWFHFSSIKSRVALCCNLSWRLVPNSSTTEYRGQVISRCFIIVAFMSTGVIFETDERNASPNILPLSTHLQVFYILCLFTIYNFFFIWSVYRGYRLNKA